jgi:hypothetical protein
MKPSLHARTVLDVTDKGGGLVRRVFMFSRREVRLGSKGRGADGQLLNELVLALAGKGPDKGWGSRAPQSPPPVANDGRSPVGS